MYCQMCGNQAVYAADLHDGEPLLFACGECMKSLVVERRRSRRASVPNPVYSRDIGGSGDAIRGSTDSVPPSEAM